MEDQREAAAAEPLPAATAGLVTAAGVADVFSATREFVTEHLKPDVVSIEDPESGATVLALVGDGSVHPLPADFFDTARDGPRFRRGTAALTSLDSFIAHVNRFGDGDTAVFADDNRTSPKITAVFDYHRADEAFDPGATRKHGEYRHGKHRSTFAFPLSDEWKAWNKGNGTVMSMGVFALFLEDRIGDIATAGDEFPEDVLRFVNVNGGVDSIADFATLIELSRGLKVYEQANVEEATNLSSGEGHIRFSVEHETRGRSGGTVKVPTMFFIAIPIFNKGPFYRIAARLRYRKTAEGVKFWYDLAGLTARSITRLQRRWRRSTWRPTPASSSARLRPDPVGDLFRYPASPGSQDRDTSRAAAAEVAHIANRVRRRVLDEFEQSNGLTADEYAGRLGLSILTVRPRVTELSRLGKLRDSGARRLNGSGRRAIVWSPVYPARLAGQRIG